MEKSQESPKRHGLGTKETQNKSPRKENDPKVVKLPPIKKTLPGLQPEEEHSMVNEEDKSMLADNKELNSYIKDTELPETEPEKKSHDKKEREPASPAKEKKCCKMEQLKELFCGNFPESDGKEKVQISHSVWDYVIVLNNPDFDSDDQRQVTREEAENLYKSCFKPKKLMSAHRQTLGFIDEISAFTDAFDMLQPFEGGKKFKNGGMFKETQDSFVKVQNNPTDFLGLCNTAILVKLVSHLTLKVKTLLSTDGRYLFYIISADEEDLESEAERTRYQKELELAVTDLISLFPCDESLRPYNMLKCPDPEVKEILSSVKGFIQNAFHLVQNKNKVDYRYEPDGVTYSQWQAYKEYLILLKDGIKKIESSVKEYKNKMILFKHLLKTSVNKVNLALSNNEKLKNLWDKLEISESFSPYVEYKRSEKDDHLKNLWRTHQIDPSGKRSIFKNIERIRLLNSYIYSQINLNALQNLDIIVAHYPFHNSWVVTGQKIRVIENVSEEEKMMKLIAVELKNKEANINTLNDTWKTAIIKQKLPLSRIRNYFGEKIGLYFEFLRFFQNSLVIPALVGLVVYILQQSLSLDHSLLLFVNAVFCLFITLYATIFLEFWKRRESALSIIWGTTEFEKIEIPRPHYKGKLRRSPITDDMEEIYYPEANRYKFFVLSAIFSLAIICIVISIVAGLIILKSKKYMIYNGNNYADTVCSILNALQIQIFNLIYSKVGKILTDMENHKTQNNYEDSFIIKTFIFQFVNSFNSLVYIAFFRCNLDDLEPSICVDELSTQLASIFIVSYAKNIIELGIPYGGYLFKKWLGSRNRVSEQEYEQDDLRSDIENQLNKPEYVTLENDGTIDDYLELAIEFGYITLFSIAFPLSTTLLFIGLWLEMMVDKLKVLKLVRRPIPLSTSDIGTWYDIFSFICALSIISNSALLCFTLPTFQYWQDAFENRYIIFLVLVAALVLFRNQIMNWIPDVQSKYETIQRRHEFLVEKYLRGTPNKKVIQDIEMFDTTLYYGK